MKQKNRTQIINQATNAMAFYKNMKSELEIVKNMVNKSDVGLLNEINETIYMINNEIFILNKIIPN